MLDKAIAVTAANDNNKKFLWNEQYVITNLFLRSNSVYKVVREVSEDATDETEDDSDVRCDPTNDDQVKH